MLRRVVDDTAGTVFPSRVTAAALARIPTKDARGLRKSNTLEHTAGFCSRERLSRIAVTRWLMASRVITAATRFLLFLPSEQARNIPLWSRTSTHGSVRQKTRQTRPDCRQQELDSETIVTAQPQSATYGAVCS